MQQSDKEIAKIIMTDSFMRDDHFKSNPKNIERLIEFILKMQPSRQSFDIVFKLIKVFKLDILLCFETLYHKVDRKTQDFKTIEQSIMEISNIVLKLNFQQWSQLLFYHQFETIEKNYKEMVKHRSLDELAFIKTIGMIREWTGLKSKYPAMKNLPEGVFQLIDKVATQHSSNNLLRRYYIDKMIQKLLVKFQVKNLEELNPKFLLKQELQSKFQAEKISEPKSFKLQIQTNSVKVNIQSSNDPNSQPKPWNGLITIPCPPVFKPEKDHPVYILLDNKKCHVPNPECYERLFVNWNIIRPLPDDVVNKIPTGAPLSDNATLIQAKGQAPVYLMNRNQKRWIPNPDKFNYFGFCKEKILKIDKVLTEGYPTGSNV